MPPHHRRGLLLDPAAPPLDRRPRGDHRPVPALRPHDDLDHAVGADSAAATAARRPRLDVRRHPANLYSRAGLLRAFGREDPTGEGPDGGWAAGAIRDMCGGRRAVAVRNRDGRVGIDRAVCAHLGCGRVIVEPGRHLRATATPTGRRVVLTISADIDGRSVLTITGRNAQWHHVSQAAPGRHLGGATVTKIGGATWKPSWPSAGENRDCNCNSNVFHGVTPPLPSTGAITVQAGQLPRGLQRHDRWRQGSDHGR